MKLTIKALNHVAIYVADVEKSIQFYQNILGLEELARPAFDFPGAWFRLGIKAGITLDWDSYRTSGFWAQEVTILHWKFLIYRLGKPFEQQKCHLSPPQAPARWGSPNFSPRPRWVLD
jgi:catechol 2,3-dioxygenase-like lactoylglutathione lyase family enzyme